MGRINRAVAAAQFMLLAASVASPLTVRAHPRDEPRDEEPEAQAGAGQDTIIVTGLRAKGTGSGTKTDALLIETPQTITVIDERELMLRNATSINQAVGYVAGVAANQRGGTVTRYDQLLVRGFAPGLYLDGMRLIAGPYSTPQTDFNRIDQIDIVKGPASVLYGNSTPGGMINLSSKKPQDTAFGRVELQAGNYDTLRAVADINQPITADGTLLFRIVGGWQKNDGFTQGTQSERYHISPMVTFAPGPDTSLTLIAAYQHAPSGGGYSGVPAHGTVLDSPAGPLPRHINTGDPAYERYDHKQKAITALFRHDFNEHLSFRSNFRYQNNTLSYRQLYVFGYAKTASQNSDYGTIVRGGGGGDEDFDTLTIDNHLSAKFTTGPIQHHLLGGIDYQFISGENFQQFNTGETANPLTSIPNLNLYAPVYGGTMPSLDLALLSPAYINTRTKRDQVGLYLQDQASIGRLRLIASGRWDWYNQTAINQAAIDKNLPGKHVTRLSQAAFTMRLGALYEFGFGLSPYVSYSESFEPQTGATWLGVPFDPVTGKMIETGLKYQPAGANALFTLSVYDLRRQNVPVADPRGGTNGIPTNSQVQIGEVRVRGVEIEGRGEVAPGFDVILAAAYTDAILTQGAPALPPTATSNGTPSTTGTRQLGTPEWQASTFLAYDLAKAGHEGLAGGLTLGAGVRYVSGSAGSTSFSVINNRATFQGFMTEDFTLVDGVIGYDLAYLGRSLRGWSVAVNAANLLDARYISACPFSNSCYFGASRTVTGSLRFKW